MNTYQRYTLLKYWRSLVVIYQKQSYNSVSLLSDPSQLLNFGRKLLYYLLKYFFQVFKQSISMVLFFILPYLYFLVSNSCRNPKLVIFWLKSRIIKQKSADNSFLYVVYYSLYALKFLLQLNCLMIIM